MTVGKKDIIKIRGGIPLQGTTRIQGSKNTALPLMAASLLIKGITVLYNCPNITDVFYMKKLLLSVGCKIAETEEADGSRTLTIDASDISQSRLPREYVEKMRSSMILTGALLARVQEARILQPGGCVIGNRPIDLHLLALRALGTEIVMEEEIMWARCRKPTGAVISFPKVSVGATENAILLAVVAKSETLLINASGEPEVIELIAFLNQAGAEIKMDHDVGQCRILINGGKELHSVLYRVPADRIVAGTYAFAALAAGGAITLTDTPTVYMQNTIEVVRQMGAEVIIERNDGLEDTIHINACVRPKAVPYLETAVYPGFATDLQSAFMVASVLAEGRTILTEKIFENRFRILEELRRMGAKVKMRPEQEKQSVEIEGVESLQGCNVLAKELRGGAALVLAGIAAEGITTVGNIHFIERGYENMERDFKRLGASISHADECD